MSVTLESTSLNIMESRNIGFYSCNVEEGFGEAIIIATGDDTVIGRMSKFTQSTFNDDEVTGLHREVNRFILFVVLITIVFVIILWLTWAFWLKRVYPNYVTVNENIIHSIEMIVGFLPLGLPSAVTLGELYSKHYFLSDFNVFSTHYHR